MESFNYWNGRQCFHRGLPWLVPSAVDALAQEVQPTWRAAEFGAGGSTIWFAERCESVVSYENNAMWCGIVAAALKKRRLENVDLQMCHRAEALLDIAGRSIDILLVDSKPVAERLQILLGSLASVAPGGLVVVDNHGRVRPSLADVPAFSAIERCEAHDDPRWCGCGTLIMRTRSP